MVTVVCMKWGTPFPAEYVNVLYNGVCRNLSQPFQFVCFTDDPKGLDPNIVAKPIPEIDLPPERWKSGCWPKLTIFKAGALEGTEAALYLDLDVMVQGPLDPFFDQIKSTGGFHILREWNPALWNLLPVGLRPDRGCQGSIIGWVPGEHDYIFEELVADLDDAFSRCVTDQDFLTYTARNRQYWPHEWCVSFKRTCLWYYPFNLLFKKVPQPKKARVVVFHGDPRPVDLVQEGNSRWGTNRKFGFGPVGWVKDYWYAGAQTR
ncbi:MAG TPA: hypothetical protein VNQ76_06040 [Planctomicrobium sp.]|nr:hypothetical protein [Planctomicrobium sp.]